MRDDEILLAPSQLFRPSGLVYCHSLSEGKKPMQKEPYARENILIVDDTPDNLRLLAKMLTDRGYKVRPAPSGTHALVTIRKELPDLILLDLSIECRTLDA